MFWFIVICVCTASGFVIGLYRTEDVLEEIQRTGKEATFGNMLLARLIRRGDPHDELLRAGLQDVV